MGTHPNVILKLTLTPEETSRKTLREILAACDVTDNSDPEILIGTLEYRAIVMEEEYNESWQISAKEGDMAMF